MAGKVKSKQAPIKRNIRGPGSKKKWNDLQPHHHFYANDGQIVKNLKELPAAIRQMNMQTFMHHVSQEHNHFANWIEDCMKSKKVGADVRKATSKTALLKTLGRHL
tara:strand:+ start:47089 stop:47406 length:318 start_codon:yes stop_codon:yes gene_type:complete